MDCASNCTSASSLKDYAWHIPHFLLFISVWMTVLLLSGLISYSRHHHHHRAFFTCNQFVSLNAWLGPKAFGIIKGQASLNCTLINIFRSSHAHKAEHSHIHIKRNCFRFSFICLRVSLSSSPFSLSLSLSQFPSQLEIFLNFSFAAVFPIRFDDTKCYWI